MSEAIVVALITGAVSLIGTIITVILTSNKTVQEMRISQAITDTKIDELTREVRSHNNFAQRMPVVEEQIKTLDGRVDRLEGA
jgi:hypothetical protein